MTVDKAMTEMPLRSICGQNVGGHCGVSSSFSWFLSRVTCFNKTCMLILTSFVVRETASGLKEVAEVAGMDAFGAGHFAYGGVGT